MTREAEQAFVSRGLVLSILLIAALIAAGLHVMGKRPDPHFVAASEMLNNYEGGRNENARNYKNPVYEQALNELALVNPESVSYGEAHALRNDIVKRREAFFVNVRQVERDKSVRQTQRTERRAAVAANHAFSRMHPKVEYPECDE